MEGHCRIIKLSKRNQNTKTFNVRRVLLVAVQNYKIRKFNNKVIHIKFDIRNNYASTSRRSSTLSGPKFLSSRLRRQWPPASMVLLSETSTPRPSTLSSLSTTFQKFTFIDLKSSTSDRSGQPQSRQLQQHHRDQRQRRACSHAKSASLSSNSSARAYPCGHQINQKLSWVCALHPRDPQTCRDHALASSTPTSCSSSASSFSIWSEEANRSIDFKEFVRPKTNYQS